MGALIAAAIAGIFIGIASGMLGIGGGTIMVPLFRLVFGLGAVASTATSLFAIIPTSIAGAITRIRNHTCIPTLGLIMGFCGACISPIGVWLSGHSPTWAIMLGAALAIGYSATTMLHKAVKMPKRDAAAAAASAAAAEAASEQPEAAVAQLTSPSAPLKPTRTQILQGIAAGAFSGLCAGYIGIGGGFLMVPLMCNIMKFPIKLASGTSLVAVSILAIPGVINHAMLGNVDFVVGVATVVGSIPGSQIGSMLANRIPERELRFIFGGFLLVAAILLVVNELGLLG